jgi:hypothetical protein
MLGASLSPILLLLRCFLPRCTVLQRQFSQVSLEADAKLGTVGLRLDTVSLVRSSLIWLQAHYWRRVVALIHVLTQVPHAIFQRLDLTRVLPRAGVLSPAIHPGCPWSGSIGVLSARPPQRLCKPLGLSCFLKPAWWTRSFYSRSKFCRCAWMRVHIYSAVGSGSVGSLDHSTTFQRGQ